MNNKTFTITHEDGSIQICEYAPGVDETTIKPVSLAAIQASQLKQINDEARRYLSETDWYVIRQQETGVEIPVDILTERQAARNRIVDIEE